MSNLIRMAPIDEVAALIADLNLSPMQAHELRLAMMRYSKNYELTHDQHRRTCPAYRRLFDAIMMACATTINEVKLASARADVRRPAIDAD